MPDSISSDKVEAQYIEEDSQVLQDQDSNEFGHGNGNFWTAYFSVAGVAFSEII